MPNTSGLRAYLQASEGRSRAERDRARAERDRRKACHGNWHPCGPDESCGR